MRTANFQKERLLVEGKTTNTGGLEVLLQKCNVSLKRSHTTFDHNFFTTAVPDTSFNFSSNTQVDKKKAQNRN